MGFMGQKKFGDGRKYFCFQVRFRGLGTLGAWKSAKSIQNAQTRFAQTVSIF